MKFSLVTLTRSSIWVIALALGYADFLLTAQGRANDKLPPAVREQLQKNAEAMSAVHLEYSEEKTWAEVQVADLPGVKRPPMVVTFSEYFDAGRFYQRSLLNGRHVGEKAWDGNFFYVGSPPHKPGPSRASIMKFTADKSIDSDRNRIWIDCPFLLAAGYYRAQAVADLAKPSVQSFVLHAVDESHKTQIENVGNKLRVTVLVPDPELIEARHLDLKEERKNMEGGRNSPEFIAKQMNIMENMQKMEPKRTIVFLLDPNYGYGTVEREERTAAGKRIAHLVTEQWKHYDITDIWLPTRCVKSNYTAFDSFSDRLSLTATLQLKQVEFGPQRDITFSLDQKSDYKKPGSAITDRTSSKEVTYTVAADKETLVKVAEAAEKELQRSPSRIQFWIKVNLAILGLLIIAFLIFWRVRKMRAA